MPPKQYVSKKEAYDLAAKALLKMQAAKKPPKAPEFDPELGASWDEAKAKLQSFRDGIGPYGEYVHGLAPAKHHQHWIDLYHQLFTGTLPGGKNKLMILAPPNTAKSTWTSLIMPPWYLGNHPDHSILFLTSSDTMAAQFGTTIRYSLSANKLHQSVFPEAECRPAFKRGWSSDGLYLAGTPFSSKDPAYRAVGYGASVVGSRANLIILDDPLDQVKSMSETEQQKAKDYYDMTLERRMQPDGFVIAIMTRWHENDLAALFLNRPDWHVVVTPMVCPEIRENQKPDPVGRKPGELLWAERFPRAEMDKVRKTLGTALWNCVYQLDPTGMGGDVFKDAKWFKPLPENFNELRQGMYVVQGWDTAFSVKDRACFTAGVTLAIDRQNQMYIVDVFRAKLTPQETEDAIVSHINLFKPNVTAIEEAAFKTQVIKNLLRRVLGRVWTPVRIVRPTQDKVARAMLPAARAEAGLVYADKESSWWEPFLSECLGFPKTTYKDQVDAWSLATHAISESPPERPYKIRVNPYPSRTRNIQHVLL